MADGVGDVAVVDVGVAPTGFVPGDAAAVAARSPSLTAPGGWVAVERAEMAVKAARRPSLWRRVALAALMAWSPSLMCSVTSSPRRDASSNEGLRAERCRPRRRWQTAMKVAEGLAHYAYEAFWNCENGLKG